MGAAADQLDAAHISMTAVLKDFSEDSSSKGQVSFDSVAQESRVAINTWLAITAESQPQTLAQLYEVGVTSTDKLADLYRSLAAREDNRVFDDFLKATYPFLQAGAVASQILDVQK